MRGRRHPRLIMLAFDDLDTRIPAGHPMRTVKRRADRAFAKLSPVFDRKDAAGGRPSIPPERPLKAKVLIALYPVRSERSCRERLEYLLLSRWFLDLGRVDPSLDPGSFAKNRERLLRHEGAPRFISEVVNPADSPGLISDAHFTVEGALIGRRRASTERMRRSPSRPTTRGTRRSTSGASAAPTPPTPARPIRRRG